MMKSRDLGANQDQKRERWANKTTKEKLDMVFVVVAIITFSLTAYIHIKNLKKRK